MVGDRQSPRGCIRKERRDEPMGNGTDQLADLRELAGWALVTVAVVIVAAGAVSLILFVMGKFSAQSRMQATAATVAVNIFLGSAILGSLGGLVYWGSGLGKYSLMPSAAGQPTVNVTKKPAKSTCSNEIKLPSIQGGLPEGVEPGENPAPEMAVAIVGQAAVDKVQQDDHEIDQVIYTPKGPDCTEDAPPDPCKDVTVKLANPFDIVVSEKVKPINHEKCTA
ncbi:hypothetical protein [Arthrobacter pigmenti]